MAIVSFYEKPGCINNTKQKKLLLAAGHSVESHNLLTEPWTSAELRSYFGDRPVVEWFNYTAPPIKSGQINPTELDEATALELMVNNPLLIKRPLMRVEDRRESGFDPTKIDAWIGLRPLAPSPEMAHLLHHDLETCPRNSG